MQMSAIRWHGAERVGTCACRQTEHALGDRDHARGCAAGGVDAAPSLKQSSVCMQLATCMQKIRRWAGSRFSRCGTPVHHRSGHLSLLLFAEEGCANHRTGRCSAALSV